MQPSVIITALEVKSDMIVNTAAPCRFRTRLLFSPPLTHARTELPSSSKTIVLAGENKAVYTRENKAVYTTHGWLHGMGRHNRQADTMTAPCHSQRLHTVIAGEWSNTPGHTPETIDRYDQTNHMQGLLHTDVTAVPCSLVS